MEYLDMKDLVELRLQMGYDIEIIRQIRQMYMEIMRLENWDQPDDCKMQHI